MATTFGGDLRAWRELRGMSQQRLAEGAEVSARHVSFLETGKAHPSREMVLVLANALDLPLRARNTLLESAGFASVYRESPWGSPRMAPLQRALDHLLAAHEPFGAIVLDRTWNVRQMNAGAARLFATFWADGPPPRNMVRALLDPTARSVIEDWPSVMSMLAGRFAREAATCPELAAMLDELMACSDLPAAVRKPRPDAPLDPTLTVTLRRGALRARVFTAVMSMGTPLDVTAEDVRIESYFPADEATADLMRRLANGGAAPIRA